MMNLVSQSAAIPVSCQKRGLGTPSAAVRPGGETLANERRVGSQAVKRKGRRPIAGESKEARAEPFDREFQVGQKSWRALGKFMLAYWKLPLPSNRTAYLPL
jgi:hypothetical protein